MMDNDPSSPQVLANLLTNTEAAMLVARLENMGIAARMSGAGGSTGWPEAMGYTQVVVRQADLERAQTVLAELQTLAAARPGQSQPSRRRTSVHPQPLIAVHDVEASSRFYQRLLGCQSDHGGREYERLVCGGRLVMQLHRFEVEHHHGPIGDPDDRPYGNGVLLWFEIDDFDAAMDRVAELRAEIVLSKHRNPPDGDGGPNHWECWLLDPDGYTVVLASPDGTADGNWTPGSRG